MMYSIAWRWRGVAYVGNLGRADAEPTLEASSWRIPPRSPARGLQSLLGLRLPAKREPP